MCMKLCHIVSGIFKELFMKLESKLNRKTLWVYVFAILFAGCHHAQDITGNWQGTLIVPHGTPLRIVLQLHTR